MIVFTATQIRTLPLTGADGKTRTAVTSAFGYYKFANVAAGETYVLTARGKMYAFNEPTQIVNATEDAAEINFVAYPSEVRRSGRGF